MININLLFAAYSDFDSADSDLTQAIILNDIVWYSSLMIPGFAALASYNAAF